MSKRTYEPYDISLKRQVCIEVVDSGYRQFDVAPCNFVQNDTVFCIMQHLHFKEMLSCLMSLYWTEYLA